MEPDVVYPVAAVALGAVALWSFVAARRRRVPSSGRSRAPVLKRIAQRRGWSFAAGDPFGLGVLAFPLFRSGEERGFENVVWGRTGGTSFEAADLWTSGESPWGPGEGIRWFSIVVVPLPLHVPLLAVRPESMIAPPEHDAARDIHLESEEFNARFEVESRDRSFAFRLLTPHVMEWFLAMDRRFSFEIVGSAALFYAPLLPPDDVAVLIATATDFHRHIPLLVTEQFGLNPAPEAGTRSRDRNV